MQTSMTEYEQKQLYAIKQVCFSEELFLRQNKKGRFNNREMIEIFTNNPYEVLEWMEWVFRQEKQK